MRFPDEIRSPKEIDLPEKKKVPAATVKMARRVIARLAQPQQQAAMGDELIYQTFVNKSDDYAEMRAARAENRPPEYRGS